MSEVVQSMLPVSYAVISVVLVLTSMQYKVFEMGDIIVRQLITL